MREDHLDEPLPDALPPVLLQHEDVGEVGEGRAVRHHPREAGLLTPLYTPKHSEFSIDRLTTSSGTPAAQYDLLK